MSLIGTLGEFKIADVLRLFGATRKTGLLTVTGEGNQALVHFRKGALVHASAGRLQGDEAVLDLFGWKEGQLTFVPDERPLAPNVTREMDVLILEGLRVGESFHRMRELIPSDRAVFQLGPPPERRDARVSLGAAEWSVLRALDGVRDVREIADAAKLPRNEVLRVLFELADKGYLERVEPVKTLRVQSRGMFAKDSATVDLRLEEEWTQILRFGAGVLRVELKSLSGRQLRLPIEFRPGLFRDVHLPRPALQELNVAEGDDVSVRPVA